MAVSSGARRRHWRHHSNIKPMERAPFFRELTARVLEGAKSAGIELQVGRQSSWMLQVYTRRPDVHFEAWLHDARQQLEVGFHAEGPADLNRELLERLAPNDIRLKAEVHRDLEVEPWDRGWSRAYCLIGCHKLTPEVLEDAVGTMLRLVQAVEEILEEAGLELAPVFR